MIISWDSSQRLRQPRQLRSRLKKGRIERPNFTAMMLANEKKKTPRLEEEAKHVAMSIERKRKTECICKDF